MKEGDEIERNMKFFLKNSIALGDIAFRNVLLFLKIVTKWQEFQKSRLSNSCNQSDTNHPFPSSQGLCIRNEVMCSAFDMEMIFHSHANKTNFHKKVCALGPILKLMVFGTRKWPIEFFKFFFSHVSVSPSSFKITYLLRH